MQQAEARNDDDEVQDDNGSSSHHICAMWWWSLFSNKQIKLRFLSLRVWHAMHTYALFQMSPAYHEHSKVLLIDRCCWIVRLIFHKLRENYCQFEYLRTPLVRRSPRHHADCRRSVWVAWSKRRRKWSQKRQLATKCRLLSTAATVICVNINEQKNYTYCRFVSAIAADICYRIDCFASCNSIGRQMRQFERFGQSYANSRYRSRSVVRYRIELGQQGEA